MSERWIVVADSAIAYIYRQVDGPERLQLLETLVHPESREKGSELSSDRPGHQPGKGSGHGALVQKQSPKAYESARFAAEVADYLDAARRRNQLGALSLVASPGFLGELSGKLDSGLEPLIENRLDRDLTHLSLPELIERVKTFPR
ncbi:MAG: host attachment protein [Gammaproteobacteria bacterium]|nr:host attachment protein [Gammaproteobacteria bacterium]